MGLQAVLGPRVLSQPGSSSGTVSGSVVDGRTVQWSGPHRGGSPCWVFSLAPHTTACLPPQAATVLHYSRSSLRNLLVTFTV